MTFWFKSSGINIPLLSKTLYSNSIISGTNCNVVSGSITYDGVFVNSANWGVLDFIAGDYLDVSTNIVYDMEYCGIQGGNTLLIRSNPQS